MDGPPARSPGEADGDAAARARGRAVRWLAAAPKSERQIRQRLERSRFATDVIDETIAWLRRLGYLDDARLAGEFVRARKSYRVRGRGGVAWELRQSGIAEPVVQGALADYSPDEEQALAAEIAQKRAAAAPHEAPERLYRRIGGLLQRRGFSAGAIRQALRIALGDRLPGGESGLPDPEPPEPDLP